MCWQTLHLGLVLILIFGRYLSLDFLFVSVQVGLGRDSASTAQAERIFDCGAPVITLNPVLRLLAIDRRVPARLVTENWVNWNTFVGSLNFCALILRVTIRENDLRKFHVLLVYYRLSSLEDLWLIDLIDIVNFIFIRHGRATAHRLRVEKSCCIATVCAHQIVSSINLRCNIVCLLHLYGSWRLELVSASSYRLAAKTARDKVPSISWASVERVGILIHMRCLQHLIESATSGLAPHRRDPSIRLWWPDILRCSTVLTHTSRVCIQSEVLLLFTICSRWSITAAKVLIE